MKSRFKLFIAFLFIAILSACGIINKKNKGKGFNIFPISQDKQLGFQVANEIDNNTAEYPLLDSTKYAEVYRYLYKVRDNILNTGAVSLEDDFIKCISPCIDDFIKEEENLINDFLEKAGKIFNENKKI